ncbi:hypothetical protein Tco_0569402 [Tanacetum coccineum]
MYNRKAKSWQGDLDVLKKLTCKDSCSFTVQGSRGSNHGYKFRKMKQAVVIVSVKRLKTKKLEAPLRFHAKISGSLTLTESSSYSYAIGYRYKTIDEKNVFANERQHSEKMLQNVLMSVLRLLISCKFTLDNEEN